MKKILVTFLAVLISGCGTSESIATLITVKDQKIGVDTKNPDELLTVNGSIHAKEVRVDLDGALTPDYVFDHYNGETTPIDYRRMPIEELQAYIINQGHLPGVPTHELLSNNGLDLKTFSLTLLEKIEELTLYLIEQQNQIEILQKTLKMRSPSSLKNTTDRAPEKPLEKIEN